MADYYTVQQLARRVGITEYTIEELQAEGLLQPTLKNGRVFFSSQQAYRLQIAVQSAHSTKKELKETFAGVEARWFAHSTPLKG